MRRQVVFALTLALCGMTVRAVADEPFYDFLRGLQEAGYGEMATQYLLQIKDREDLPEDLKTTWDLEMARTLRIAAVETPNVDVQAKLVVDAQTHLDKFLKEQPKHPEAAAAQLTSGDISLFRAQNILKLALRDKTKRDTLLPDARKLLDESRPKFAKAIEMYKARLDQARAGAGKKKTTTTSRRVANELAELNDSWLNARFKAATVDYNVGLSYPEPKAPQRKDALLKAAKGFDAIFQENRGQRTGVYAHMWEGKAREEMEDFVTALDIYDEVMAAQPDGDDKKQAQWFAMFNEVNRYRLMLLGRTKQYDKLILEAGVWLKDNLALRRTSGYQGIALEAAKALLERAKTLKGVEAARYNQEGKRLLAEIVATPSEFQKDAILLQRLSAGQGEEVPIKNFDEAIAIGDAAIKSANDAATPADLKTSWTEAEKAYTKAMELSADVKDKNRVLQTRYALATAQYMVGKAPEAYDTAFKLAQENPAYAKAPAAAALAVNIALYLYGQARNTEALERINTVTDYLLKQWPQHSEADDARIARGKLQLIQNKYDDGIRIFLSVNPASDRYPSALQLAAQTHWTMYLAGKNKADPAKTAEVAAHRKQTVDLLQKSLAAFQKVESTAQQAAAMQDAQLLLAEVNLEGNQTTQAITLLEPLVNALKGKELTTLDRTTLRILVSAMRAYSHENKTAEAMAVGGLLVNSGDDLPPVNGVLIEYAKLVRNEWKTKAANVIAAQATADENSISNAQKEEEEARKKVTDLLTQLGSRKQYDLAALVFLAESSLEVGLTDKAREQFQAILDRAAADPAFAKTAAKAMTRVRSQIIGLLRADKQYAQALKEVEALLKDQPTALEPLMEKGNILQALAETDPKRYDEAVKWWTGIRLKLQNPAQPKKPPEYYQVIYNCAFCLVAQKDAVKSTQASQLLNSTLALAPNLDGPDRVEMYKALLKQIPASAKAASASATKGKTTAKSK